jgi:polyhydroxyalkanoate synthase
MGRLGDTAAAGRGSGPPGSDDGQRYRGCTPSEVVYAENKVRVRHYAPRTDSPVEVPVVIVYAFINRPYILDFEPGRSVVGQFLDRGFDVYLLDWGEPSRLDRHLGLDDYAGRYLPNCVDAVRERTGGEAVHLLGYCTGATLGVIYASLFPDRVSTLGLLAPLLNFDTDEGVFALRPDGFEPGRLTETVGNVPGEWLAFAFALVDPVEYHLARYLRLWDNVDDPEYVSRFARRLRWGFEPVDVAGDLFEDFLVDLDRDNALQDGTLEVGTRSVDPGALTMPVLTILGRDDRFIPASASLPFLRRIPSRDTRVVAFPVDHVGLSIDERSHRDLWPAVCDWFAERSVAGQ